MDADTLAASHTRLAHRLAADYCRANGIAQSGRDDVNSDALFGLVQAARSFDPDRGVLFATFARTRIVGAILDGMRARAWVSRSAYTDASPEQRHTMQPVSAQRLTDIRGDRWHPVLDDPGYAAVEAEIDAPTTVTWIAERLAPRSAYVILESLLAGRTLREIGADLHVTEARVCQMRKAALGVLREHVAELVGA